MKTRALLLAILLCASLAACGDPDPAPSATIVSATPLALDTSSDATDDLTIIIEYTDGDGDLGGGAAEVTDCRSGVITSLSIPPLATQEAVDEGVQIEGELDLLVADVGLVDPAPSLPQTCADLGVTATMSAGETVFCVTLVDTAGHRGSGDCTDPVQIQ